MLKIMAWICFHIMRLLSLMLSSFRESIFYVSLRKSILHTAYFDATADAVTFFDSAKWKHQRCRIVLRHSRGARQFFWEIKSCGIGDEYIQMAGIFESISIGKQSAFDLRLLNFSFPPFFSVVWGAKKFFKLSPDSHIFFDIKNIGILR